MFYRVWYAPHIELMNLCLLLEKIIIHEDEYGLRLEIRMKAPFLEKSYMDEIGMICEDDYEEVSA